MMNRPGLLPLLAALLMILPTVSTARSDSPASQPADDTQTSVDRQVRIVDRLQGDGDVHLVRLSNGLSVIIKPIHTAPVVSVRCYVRAGSMYEGQWLGCGLTHLLEHLMAQEAVSHTGPKPAQATTPPPSRSGQIGAQTNAYTTLNHTCYYLSAAADRYAEAISIVTDMVARTAIQPADFQREHGVVQRELEMNRDNPDRVLRYSHMENLFRIHPAAVPVIGYPQPLAEVTIEDVLAYRAKLYVPQNMVYVVVGDIDPDRALERVVDSFQGIPAGRAENYNLPPVPEVIGTRRLVREDPNVREAIQQISYPSIPLVHQDLYALDLLSTLLSTGRSSRLVQRLQFDRQVVTSISTWSWTPTWGRGFFTIEFRCRPEQADAAEQAIADQLAQVIDNGVQADELRRAKTLMIASHVRNNQTAEDIAATLATDWMFTGDIGFSQRYIDRIQAVTAEQVQTVARRYLGTTDRVITRMIPAADTDAATTRLATTTQPGQATVTTLPNGLKLVLAPSDAVDLVTLAYATPGGLLLETPDTNGLGELMTQLSLRGAGDFSGDDIAAFFNAAGGSIGATCGDNSFLWTASLLSDNANRPGGVAEALDRFADVILQPTFPPDELAKLKPLALAAIQRTEQNWTGLLSKFFRRRFFVQSPWRMLSSGRIPVIQQATAKQLADYHAHALHGPGSVLAVYGKFDASAIKAQIEKRFAALPDTRASIDLPAPRTVADGGEIYVLKTATQQAGVIVAAPGTVRSNIQDNLALLLIDTIASGYRMPSGWLHKELRGKELVYVVHAYHKTGFAPGAFVVYAGTQPAKAPQVVQIIRKNLEKAVTHPYSREELDRAITTIVTAKVLGLQTLSARCTSAALDEMYGLGVDWPARLQERLSALTPQQVQAVAKKYLANPLVVTVITPQPDAFPDATHLETLQELK